MCVYIYLYTYIIIIIISPAADMPLADVAVHSNFMK